MLPGRPTTSLFARMVPAELVADFEATVKRLDAL